MASVLYIAQDGDNSVPECVFNPKSKTSLEEFSDVVLNALEESEDIDFDEWLEHPAYIATITGDFRKLKDILEAHEYQLREIPVA